MRVYNRYIKSVIKLLNDVGKLPTVISHLLCEFLPVFPRYPKLAYSSKCIVAIRLDGTIKCRSLYYHGSYHERCDGPKGSNFVSVVTCNDYYAALQNDGRLTMWGEDLECFSEEQLRFTWIEISGNNVYAVKCDGSIVYMNIKRHRQIKCKKPQRRYVRWRPFNKERKSGFISFSADNTQCHNSSLRYDGTICLRETYTRNHWNRVVPISERSGFISVHNRIGNVFALHENGTIYKWGTNDDEYREFSSNSKIIEFSTIGYNGVIALKEDGSLEIFESDYKPPEGNNFTAVASCHEHPAAMTSDEKIFILLGGSVYNCIDFNYKRRRLYLSTDFDMLKLTELKVNILM